MIRGTRILFGPEACLYDEVVSTLRELTPPAYKEVFVPVLADPSLWATAPGTEIERQMWAFPDKGGRPTCLIPEVTAVVRREYRDHWASTLPKPVRVFYVSRCYRYERPQAGRYREFTQFGVEVLGPEPASYEREVRDLLRVMLGAWDEELTVEHDGDVARGLSYYRAPGFEARIDSLGAQKQVAGGGTYDEGCGFAIGVDRLMLALEKSR